MAAASKLAEAGWEVEVLETRASIGGRCHSLPADPKRFPLPCDNGPHLFLGCYREARAFLSRIEAQDPFQWVDPLALRWRLPGGREVGLKCASLPAPLHLLFGLLTSDAFSLGEKIRLARGLRRLKKGGVSPDLTVEDFLRETGQGPGAVERFWGPLARAVLNVPRKEGMAASLTEVVRRAFFGSREDSALGIPAKPLTDLAATAFSRFISQNGGRVCFGEGAARLSPSGSGVEVVTAKGRVLKVDAVVVAVPPRAARKLFPDRREWENLGESAILSVDLRLNRPLFSGHLRGLSGATFEWVFHRDENWGLPEGTHAYTCVWSAAGAEEARLPAKALVERALAEIRSRFPEAGEVQLLASRVGREPSATFRWNKDTAGLRPSLKTGMRGVFLAGDWTDTGLPATLEGAAQSGHRAAEGVLGENP